MPEWSKGEDLRSSGINFRVGSNPTGDNSFNSFIFSVTILIGDLFYYFIIYLFLVEKYKSLRL